MKQEERRRELDRMLMDVAKYLATVGLIGSILSEKLTTTSSIITIAVVGIIVLVAFYIIPPKQGE